MACLLVHTELIVFNQLAILQRSLVLVQSSILTLYSTIVPDYLQASHWNRIAFYYSRAPLRLGKFKYSIDKGSILRYICTYMKLSIQLPKNDSKTTAHYVASSSSTHPLIRRHHRCGTQNIVLKTGHKYIYILFSSRISIAVFFIA